jgi:hypothetical protein
MTVNGVRYAERRAAGKALIDCAVALTTEGATSVGAIRGFETILKVSYEVSNSFDDQTKSARLFHSKSVDILLRAESVWVPPARLSDSDLGTIASIEGALRRLDDDDKATQERIVRAKIEVEALRQILGEGWEYEALLAGTRAKLGALDRELLGGKEHEGEAVGESEGEAVGESASRAASLGVVLSRVAEIVNDLGTEAPEETLVVPQNADSHISWQDWMNLYGIVINAPRDGKRKRQSPVGEAQLNLF